MHRDKVVRKALWTTTAFNVGGAILFAFPASIGALVGLPAPVPALYSTMLAAFVLLFAGAYAYAASGPVVDRSLVLFGAIGKTSAFAIVFACWLAGETSLLTVVAFTGDLLFAAIFFWWLFGE